MQYVWMSSSIYRLSGLSTIKKWLSILIEIHHMLVIFIKILKKHKYYWVTQLTLEVYLLDEVSAGWRASWCIDKKTATEKVDSDRDNCWSFHMKKQ